MRLIDANELLRVLALEPMENRTYWRANEIVLDQPTAYDIEDIIKQLEKEKERQKENAIDRNYRFGVVNGLNVSIGIVKGGLE